MLRINLLPIKAAKKGETARQELLAMMGGMIVLIALLYVWNSMVSAETDEMIGKISAVKKEIGQLKQDVVKVEDFKSKAAALERKIKAIGSLQTRRVGPAQMLDDLATILTEERKVWLTELIDRDGTVSLKGSAMEEENISDFQLALERRSKYFSDVRLVMMKSVPKDGVTYLDWSMTCKSVYGPSG